jgi:hypothetical protein
VQLLGGIPFPYPYLGGIALGCLAVRLARGSLPPLAVLVVAAIVGATLTDLNYLPFPPFSDLGIYLKAGARFATDHAVYRETPLTTIPADRSNYPYLYPPFTLPLFDLLARRSTALVEVAWTLVSIAAMLVSFRLLGIRARWWLALLLWPPVFVGLFVGNIAVVSTLLYVAAPWFGALLVVSGVFKAYSLVAAAWLVRERRWPALAIGMALLVLAALVAVPWVDAGLWPRWVAALDAFRRSEDRFVLLYGAALVRYLPFWAVVATTALCVVAAWRVRGPESLARLGIATIVAAPSLYSFGFIVALPAFLYLPLAWGWAMIAATSVAPTAPWWIPIAVVGASWAVPELRSVAARRRRPAEDETQPKAAVGVGGGDAWRLLEGDVPWPHAPTHEPWTDRLGGRPSRGDAVGDSRWATPPPPASGDE